MARKMHTFRVNVEQTFETIALVSVESYADDDDEDDLVRRILALQAEAVAKEAVQKGEAIGKTFVADRPLVSRSTPTDSQTWCPVDRIVMREPKP